MHPTSPAEARPASVAVRLPCGTRATFPSIRKALLAVGHPPLCAASDGFRVQRGGFFGSPSGFMEFRDVYGDLISAHTIVEEACRIEKERDYRRLFRRKSPFTYRSGPVPSTGRRSGGSWFRSIGTTQERRDAAACKADGLSGLVRGSRNVRNLPNAWDDIPRSSERSWKRHRRTQWKQG